MAVWSNKSTRIRLVQARCPRMIELVVRMSVPGRADIVPVGGFVSIRHTALKAIQWPITNGHQNVGEIGEYCSTYPMVGHTCKNR
ncbi:hypothetical protein DERF_004673 [Dermatophagoides farinae]|uniref:Uncharacterized protein n=1 Tax=Dermatophagoides farinae TaxID=6954 RepID=A0A922I7U5_DERFA|nr:hypothetical protein DERF_004673 [Dermatophagoides farinae]